MLLGSNFDYLQGWRFLPASLVSAPGLNRSHGGELFPICPLLQLVPVTKKGTWGIAVTSRTSPDLQQSERPLAPAPMGTGLSCFVSTIWEYIFQKQGLLKFGLWLDLEDKGL